MVQRPILYLGEMNDGQREAWCHQIEAFDEASGRHRQAAVRSIIRAKPEVMNGDPRSQQSASARVSDRHPELAHGFHDGWDIGVGVAQEFLGLAAESEQFGTSEIGGV